MSKLTHLLAAFLVMAAFAVSARPGLTADDIVGTWKYTVSNVPPEYETGVMTFEQKEGKTIGFIGQQNRMEMRELTVDGGKVTFKLDLQGDLLQVTMTREGNKLTGVVTSQNGEFPITAVKETADFIGTWKYTVSDVPPEYETGFMTFEQKDGKTTGYLGKEQRVEMKELVVAPGKITFKIDFQGDLPTFSLTPEGDKLIGMIATQGGSFPITAVREVKK